MELSSSNINKFQEKILIFKETETLKKLLRKDAPKELLIVSQKKAFVIFWKRETFPKYFTTDFYYCFSVVFISPIFFTMTVFLSGTSFLCCCTASGTDSRELFLLAGIFVLNLSGSPATFKEELPAPREALIKSLDKSLLPNVAKECTLL